MSEYFSHVIPERDCHFSHGNSHERGGTEHLSIPLEFSRKEERKEVAPFQGQEFLSRFSNSRTQ